MNGWKQKQQVVFFKLKSNAVFSKFDPKWLKGAGLYGALAWILFGNPLFVFMWGPSIYFFSKRKSRQQNLLEKRQVLYDFVDFLDYFNISVMSGYSMENSIIAYIEQSKRHPDGVSEGSFLVKFELASKRLKLGGTIKSFLMELEQQFVVNEIRFFSICLNTGILMGGDLKEMVYETSRQIKQKIMMEQDIAAIVAEKKMEVAIMGAMPYGVLIMMKYTMLDMVQPFFRTWQGLMALFVLFIYFECARTIGDHIVDIQL